MHNWVPLKRNSSCQKWLTKNGSRSETKLRGRPWSFAMISMNKQATAWVICEEESIPRWVLLEKQSTTTKITVCLWYGGRPIMKSSERSSQGRWGTGSGHNRPASLLVSYFVCWQSRQLATNWVTFVRIAGQQKFSDRWANVFVTPIWPPVGVEWYSVSSVGIIGNPRGSQIRLFFRTRLWEILNSGYVLGQFIISWSYLRYLGRFANCWWRSPMKVRQGIERINSVEAFCSGSLDKASVAWLFAPDRYWIW